MKRTNKNRIRLTEAQLHQIIKESVNQILREDFEGEGAKLNGFKGIMRGIYNRVGNGIDSMRQDAYVGQMNANTQQAQSIQSQIKEIENNMQTKATEAYQNSINQDKEQIQQLNQQISKYDNSTIQNKFNDAGNRINNRMQSGVGFQRGYKGQDAANPRQGFTNYNNNDQ